MISLLSILRLTLIYISCVPTQSQWFTPSGFDIELIAFSNTSFVIYWIEPTEFESVRVYQVIYNITVKYNTKYGVREFRDQAVRLHSSTHIQLPLYTKDTTYSIQVTAITNSSERIYSKVKILNSSHFKGSGLDDAITYMQLRLFTPMECTMWLNMFEHKQHRIFSIRLAMIIGMYTRCCEDKMDDTEKCHLPIVNMVDEDMKCVQSDKVVYQARIIGTKSLSPGKVLEYINKWVLSSNSHISVYEATNIYNMDVDEACPVYLPSPTDPSCIPQVHVIDITNVVLFIATVILMSLMTVLLVKILAYVIKLIRTRIAMLIVNTS